MNAHMPGSLQSLSSGCAYNQSLRLPGSLAEIQLPNTLDLNVTFAWQLAVPELRDVCLAACSP